MTVVELFCMFGIVLLIQKVLADPSGRGTIILPILPRAHSPISGFSDDFDRPSIQN
jgi:hypothetical protein